jgi:pimeloyl-ACP methyl ester carboxylesterase
MRTSTASSIVIIVLLAAAEVGVTQDAQIPKEGAARQLSRANVDGLELEYETRGSGEPVVLVHAGIFAAWFKPLLDEPALTGRYRVVSYHRVGYAGSSRVAGPVSIPQQAAHLRSLMRHLGIERAHVVGHSSGGNIALQLALDAPEMVHSLVLMEPALPVTTLGPERMLATRAAMAPVFEAFRAGDKARAVDGFMRGVSGPSYRAVLEQVLPGAFEQGVVDADTFFGQELPSLQQWSLTVSERMLAASLSLSSPSSARRARSCLPSGASATRCSLPGCRKRKTSSSPTQPIFYTSSIPAPWPGRWRPSSPVTRSRRHDHIDRPLVFPRICSVSSRSAGICKEEGPALRSVVRCGSAPPPSLRDSARPLATSS